MRKQLKIAICDDFQVDREALRVCVTNFFRSKNLLVSIDEFASGEEFISCEKVYDIVFLDIFMKGLNGMEVAFRLLGKNVKTKIIFCSSSAEFAVDSYNVFAFGYLLKPVKSEKVNSTLEHYLRVVPPVYTIEINTGKSTEIIKVNDVVWVEASRKKCIFHTLNGEFELTIKLSDIYSMLEPYGFIKPIRYAIVSLEKIANIRSNIVMSNGDIVPVSRDMKEEIKQIFADYNWNLMLKNSEVE